MKRPPLYFVGIGGVGMASVAGLARSAGFEVVGSDQNLYPPTSYILEDLKISVATPYSPDNVEKHKDALFVIGNSMSRQHVEVAKILEIGASFTSFPKLLHDFFLTKTCNIVVCGTHGKTTTSSLLAYVLEKLGTVPSYMIGGAPADLAHGFQWGKEPFFVLEGDEYDTAFFDKGSKFLHYRPTYIVFNNLEYDHADIFPDLHALKKTFHQLLDQVSDPECIIANVSDPGVSELLKERGSLERVTPSCKMTESPHYNASTQMWEGDFETSLWGRLHIVTSLPGSYNFSNIGQVLATLTQLVKSGRLQKPDMSTIQDLIRNFHGVARRWDHLGKFSDIHIYVDFAHHPTAVNHVLKNIRIVHPKARIFAAFEPKNASSRRNVFQKQYGEVLKQADQILIAPAPEDKRLTDDMKLNPQDLCRSIGAHAQAFSSFDALYSWLTKNLQANDVLVFLSSGDFAGIPRKLAGYLDSKVSQNSLV